jgi:hypothetical protein
MANVDNPHFIRFGTPIDQIRIGTDRQYANAEFFGWTARLRKLADQLKRLAPRPGNIPRALRLCS